MSKLLLRILVVLVGFVSLTIPAKAQFQAIDQVVVNVPFSFVAAGQTFPAGEYKISRVSDKLPEVLVLSSRENRGDGVILRAVTQESAVTDSPKLNFTSVGGQHVLSRIDTGYYSYTLSVPNAEPLLATAPNRGAAPSAASGSN